MRPIEDIAREAGGSSFRFKDPDTREPMPLMWSMNEDSLTRFAAIVRAEALEEAAKVCDVTPPYPFRASIEAAHAIRALKDAP